MRQRTLIRHQKGAATVLLAGTLLFLITFIVLFTGRSEVTDIKSTSTDIFMAQAIAAAQAGLETALSLDVDRPTLKGKSLPWTARTGTLTFTDDQGTTINSGSIDTGTYSVEIDTDVSDDAKIWIKSTGVASDGETTRELKQFAEFNPVVSAVPSIHAIIRGNFAPATPSQMFNNDKDGTNDIVGWVGGGTADFDQTNWIITGDTVLKNTPTDEFFSYFFSGSKNSVKAVSEQLNCSSTCSKNDVATAGLVYWITGDIYINGGTIGLSDKPVILIIDGGSLTLKNTTVNGFIYVGGNWDNGGNSATLNGAFVVEDDLSNVGSLTVNKNVNNSLANLGDMAGAYVIYPGSWTEY